MNARSIETCTTFLLDMFVKHSCGTLLWQVHNVCFFVQVLRHSHSLRLNSKHVGPKGPNAPPNIIDIWQTGRGVPSIFTQPNGKVYIYIHMCVTCVHTEFFETTGMIPNFQHHPHHPHHQILIMLRKLLSSNSSRSSHRSGANGTV